MPSKAGRRAKDGTQIAAISIEQFDDSFLDPKAARARKCMARLVLCEADLAWLFGRAAQGGARRQQANGHARQEDRQKQQET